MTETELFNTLGLHYHTLPGKLDARTAENFVKQFREMFSQPEAKRAVSVVYVWATQRGVDRLKGHSNVVYIGKTTQSLRQRHRRYAEIEGAPGNWCRYGYIIEAFGRISVHYASHADPKEAERKLLKLYLGEHLEIPPLNRMS